MITAGFIKAIQDIMRKDRGIGTGDIVRQLDQLIWMIFLKAFDDIEKQKQFINSSYQNVVPEKYRWSTWAASDEGITGDKLLDFINNDLMPSLRDLPAKNENAIIRIAFEESHNYMKDGTLLRQVVNKISTVDFNSSTDRHTFNDLYETLLSSLQSAGDAGEYYTPRAVTKFITEMVAPKLGESVLDPACGTGGFLSSAIDILHEQAKTPEDMALIEKSIHGVEKMQLPYSLCIVNMMLHGIENPVNIRYDNTLSKPLVSYGPKDYVDTIVANPPFGGQEVDGIEKNFPATFRTKETADLFLVLIIRLLKENGRAGIVLPDGTLFGDGVKNRIKEHLLSECNLHTIVRLPKSVFAPYTPIATNLLFFTKGKPTKEVWYYEHRLPEGAKSYNKTSPIKSEEFEPLKQWWTDRKETDQAWKVSIEDIRKRGYNLDFKNPNVSKINELNPEDVLNSHREKWRKIDAVADELQSQLKSTLKHHDNHTTHFLATNLHEYLRIPEATNLLRKTILHLAVSGKLVQQDPSEGTGEELYQQIQSVKRGLVADGKLKNQKPLPEIDKDEIPFDIPKSWKWVRLSGIVDFHIGRTPPRKESSYWDEDYSPWVSIADLQAGKVIYRTKELVSKKAFKDCFKSTYVPSGTLLYSFKLTIGKMSILGMDAVHNEAIASLKTYSEVTTRYLFKALGAIDPTARTSAAIKGSTLNSTTLSILEVPLPPLLEQKRIVEKLSKILDLVDDLEKIIGADR